MTTTNCICIKYGNRYGPEYVNRLHSGLRRNSESDIRLVCMTDDRTGIHPEIEVVPLADEPFHQRMFTKMEKEGWQAPYRKVSLYRPDLVPDLDGPLILFDIDVVVVGNIDVLRDYAPGKVCMRRSWDRHPGTPQLGHGSVEKFEPKLHGYIYEALARDPEGSLVFGHGYEQIFTSRTAEKAGDFEPFPDEWIASFKYDCRPMRPLNMFLPPRLPPEARVVCFHGAPKMHEAVAGYYADPLHMTRRADWLTEAWRD